MIIQNNHTLLEMIDEERHHYTFVDTFSHDLPYYQEIIKYANNQSANKYKDDKNNGANLKWESE